MAVIVNFLRGLAYAAITFLCVVVGITVLQVSREVKSVAATAKASIAATEVVTNKQIVSVGTRANLTLKNLDYLILNAGLTANVARKASLKELIVLDQLNKSIQKTVDNTNKTLVSTNAAVTKLSKDSSAVLATANQTIKDAQPTLAASTAALDSLNKVISDPAIPATINNAKESTAALTDTVKHFDGMVIDTAGVWHKFLHPTWPRRIYGFLTGKALPVAAAVVK